MFVHTNTVKAVKSYFKDRLKNQFSESEIRSMLRESVIERLKITPSDYLLSDDLLLSESDLLYFRSIVKRLQSNEPFQHIIGWTIFYDLKIKTDGRGLIPRPETEELVHWVLESFSNQEELSVLDLCTGTGCIALALKSNRQNWVLNANDLSLEALSLAKENANQLQLDIDFCPFDVTQIDNYSNFELASFDCWVSNPPYIPEKERLDMSKNVTEYEPHMALFVPNEDPLLFYRSIAEAGMKYLKNDGQLFFEIHEKFGEETKSLLESLGYQDVEIRNDLQRKERMARATRKGLAV